MKREGGGSREKESKGSKHFFMKEGSNSAGKVVQPDDSFLKGKFYVQSKSSGKKGSTSRGAINTNKTVSVTNTQRITSIQGDNKNLQHNFSVSGNIKNQNSGKLYNTTKLRLINQFGYKN